MRDLTVGLSSRLNSLRIITILIALFSVQVESLTLGITLSTYRIN